jgi:hypothetical protein
MMEAVGHHRGSKHLWNVGLLRQDYRNLYPRRLSSSSFRLSVANVANSTTLFFLNRQVHIYIYGHHLGSKHLWNVGLLRQDYKALYPRRLPFKFLTLCGQWCKFNNFVSFKQTSKYMPIFMASLIFWSRLNPVEFASREYTLATCECYNCNHFM